MNDFMLSSAVFHSDYKNTAAFRSGRSAKKAKTQQKNDRNEAYVSPIAKIHQDIRRKNGAAGQQYATLSSDPWDAETTEPIAMYCTCRSRRRTTSNWKKMPPRKASTNCLKCGRMFQASQTNGNNGSTSNFAWSNNRPAAAFASHPGAAFGHHDNNINNNNKIPTGTDDKPRHADALLQATPQLRLLSSASTDIQGIGHATHGSKGKNLLTAVLHRTDSSKPMEKAMGGVHAEYKTSQLMHGKNQQAAAKLASLMWLLAHEMSLEDYGTVESDVFKSVFGLVHDSRDKGNRMAGLAALNALLAAPSADDERKAIKFANTLSNSLRASHGDYEFLSAVSQALGHMATKTANVDFVECEVTRALEWLRTERSDRRLAACLSLKQFALHLPTTFHSKTSNSTLGQVGSNEFLDHIFQAIRDPQPIVRTCAADALSQCLNILVERNHPSLTGHLCEVHFNVMDGLEQVDTSKKLPWQVHLETEAAQHGSLLVVATMIAYTHDFMVPRFEEICRAVLNLSSLPKPLIQLEVVRLLPRLARRLPQVFGKRYLEESLSFLMQCADASLGPRVGVDLRPPSYTSLGQLILAMSDETTGTVIGGSNLPSLKIVDHADPAVGIAYIVEPCGILYTKIKEIFKLVRKGLRGTTTAKNYDFDTIRSALHCAANLVEAFGGLALPYISDLIDDMFRAGLSNDLIQCLQSIAECIPEQQNDIENRILQGVSLCLTGSRNVIDPLASHKASVLHAQANKYNSSPRGDRSMNPNAAHDFNRESSTGDVEGVNVTINMSIDLETVEALVLGLETLSSFGGTTGKVMTTGGGMVPLLPFIQDAAARYLSHPSDAVRKSAALTCCALLIPHGGTQDVGSYSGLIVEDVLQQLLGTALSDSSATVRVCVVRALDSRYDTFLCQSHHLRDLFLLLQDEKFDNRAAGLQLLGRLASINPGPILPVLRRLLNDLIVELQCGVGAGRVREDATRLLVFFLKAKSLQRLVLPVLSTLVKALPLDEAAPPRLASVSLEALGELAEAIGKDLQPWVKEVIPHVLEMMKDRSSASKQRTSLRTLGQIAGSTGYVISPYLEYPKLLSQATDILPATKRAPWSLRREVIRTLGIVGALDPDRYHEVSAMSKKSGPVGGVYFEVDLTKDVEDDPLRSWGMFGNSKPVPISNSRSKAITTSEGSRKKEETGQNQAIQKISGDQEPAYIFMYEQYAMVAQPVSPLPPAKRMTPSDDAFYPTVTIQALMRIFQDQALAVHHAMVVEAVMFIFKSLGLRCVPYLRKVVPHMLHAVRTCAPSTLRESLLVQLATLSVIVREHLRPFVADIFDVVEEFWSTRHLATIFSLISNLAVGSPGEFRRFVPRLVKRLLATLDELQIFDWSTADSQRTVLGKGRSESERLMLILKSIVSLRGVLGDYLQIIVPALLKLADSLATLMNTEESSLPNTVLVELSVLVYRAIASLLESLSLSEVKPLAVYVESEKFISRLSSENGLSARVVQPLVRILLSKPPKSPTIGLAIVETLCVCVHQIGGSNWVELYDETVRNAITAWQATFPLSTTGMDMSASSIRIDDRIVSCLELYDDAVDVLCMSPKYEHTALSNQDGADPPQIKIQLAMSGYSNTYPSNSLFDQASSPAAHPNLNGASRQKVNQGKLQRAWDVSQRASRDDWDEWMRRLGIQFLREAPSPSLRAAANLAQAYQPLARELFSAAFACCWKELNEPFRVNLVHALQTAFVADVSPEILQALLNLAEFMEQDPSGGLPIEIPVLADLALKCRAYAKALHYKEKEYAVNRSNSCVEALIGINGKLDLPEAALGVLKVSNLGDSKASIGSLAEGWSSEVTRHQAYDMFYSVIWNTEDSHGATSGPGDISAREELWLARLGAWTEALAVYEEKLKRDPDNSEAVVGSMQCLIANGEWQKVLDFTSSNGVNSVEPTANRYETPSQRKAVRMCAEAAWRLGQWGELEKFASQLVGGSEQPSSTTVTQSSTRDGSVPKIDFDGAFYSAVLHVHRREWPDAANAIDAARRAMDGRLTALMAESYSRAYPSMVAAQTLAEMEEIIELRKMEERADSSVLKHPVNRPKEKDARSNLLSVWRKRLAGCRVDTEVHASILAVRSLVLGPLDEVEATLTLSDLSRQSQRYKFAERVLLDPLEAMHADLDGASFGLNTSEQLNLRMDFSNVPAASFSMLIDRIVAGDLNATVPSYGLVHEQWSRSIVDEVGGLEKLLIQYRLYFALVRHQWYTNRRPEAVTRLSYLCDMVDMISHYNSEADTSLRVTCWSHLGRWKLSQAEYPSSTFISEPLQADVLIAFKRATLLPECGYKAWHDWALLNFRIAIQTTERENTNENAGMSVQQRKTVRSHIIAAVKGFVNAIGQGTKKWCASVQQDLLNLLTCLFKYGNFQDIASMINVSIGSVPIEAWLGVLPQLLARIHIKDPSIRSVLHPLLTRLGERHPQALMYPLSVLVKSPVTERKLSAESLMNSLKNHSSELVEEALMVSSELIRVAILWLETWHEGLEDASRLYYGDGNVIAMLELLLPLHEQLEQGAQTGLESDFLSNFGQSLETAHFHVKDYIRIVSEDGVSIPSAAELTKGHGEEAEAAMNRAWDTYYTVFRRINKQLPSLTKLELTQCSPALNRARSLELGVPGSYRVDGSYVNIEKFIPSVEVITSKQRPRKITLRGSDGNDYVFLLKGHEDLRQDERVMQLFGLVNALLIKDPQTRKHDLKIQRYAICPLSHNCGIVGWVPHCDTFHSLIRDYRHTKKIPLNMENREMLKVAPDFDLLTVMQKVEVFIEALKRTTGQGNDLYEILWLKSTNSEEWLERRTKFTRSLAVMSMVGYILGLGDRHPSNLMLDKLSGRVLHIDFGDCFEVSMNRERFPERIPFRLTRMLVRAMEVSGIEGSYRSTCEKTMTVLRDSRDSLVAMLEAFVYDPLISWRLGDFSASVDQESYLGASPSPLRKTPVASNTAKEGVSIESTGRYIDIVEPISEGFDEDGGDCETGGEGDNCQDAMPAEGQSFPVSTLAKQQHGTSERKNARSLQIYRDMQSLAANLATDSRIASITGDKSNQASTAESSMARSRIERSMKQREYMMLMSGDRGAAHEEALNSKALKVIRRVEDKLAGTDFPDCCGEPLDVSEQVQRLIVQATSSENLCQLFVGWCSFW